MSPEPLTVDELAALLHCKPITVYRRVADGTWPSSKPAGRRLFTPEHVTEILRLSEQAARPAQRTARRKAS